MWEARSVAPILPHPLRGEGEVAITPPARSFSLPMCLSPAARQRQYAGFSLVGARPTGANVRATCLDLVSSERLSRRCIDSQNRRSRRRPRKESGGRVLGDRTRVRPDRSTACAERTKGLPRHSAETPSRGQGSDLRTKGMHLPHPPWPQERVSVARSSRLEYVLLDLVPRPT